MILGIQTHSTDTSLFLLSNDGSTQEDTWQSGRELASTILSHIDSLLAASNSTVADIKGIVVYKGPGSFTGLRIGVTVANTLSYSLGIPIIGSEGMDWFDTGAQRIRLNQSDGVVVPLYGSEPHITM